MVKLVNQDNLCQSCYIIGSFMCNKWKILGLWFNGLCFRFLERNCFICSYVRMTENAFDPLPLPSSILVPMCFCDDPYKVAKSDEEDTYMQSNWMCDNFTFEPTLRQRRITKMVGN